MSRPSEQYPPPQLSPEEFERFVKSILDEMGNSLEDYRSSHRDVVGGGDGDYEIDITARFSALGAHFLVLIECKRHSSPVKREHVQSLWAKVQSTAAQKGILCSISGFQSGAIEFAQAHGIALITIKDGRTSYRTRSVEPIIAPIPWEHMPPGVPRLIGEFRKGSLVSNISSRHTDSLAREIGLLPETLD